MRNKIQKYLSGDHEGFSLVELIIVIAIMAILIGVVALAVLPYLEKSRESKDMSTMDTVCSALSSAVASAQVSDDAMWAYTGTGTANAVEKEMFDSMGTASTALKSSALNGASIYCVYNATSNLAYVYAAKTSGTPLQLKRTITGYGQFTANTTTKPVPLDGGKYAVVSN